jgi:hypothetical protein
MCTVPLPSGVNPIAVDKYITSLHICPLILCIQNRISTQGFQRRQDAEDSGLLTHYALQWDYKILTFWKIVLTTQRQKHYVRSKHYQLLTPPRNVICQKIKNPLHHCCGNRSHTQQDTATFRVMPHNGQLDIMLKQSWEKYETERASPIAAFFTKNLKEYTCKSNFFPCTAY